MNSAKDFGRSSMNKNVTYSINYVVVTNQVNESGNINGSCTKRKYKGKMVVEKLKIIKKVNKNKKTQSRNF